MPGLDPLSEAFAPMSAEERRANELASLRALCQATGSVSDKRFERVFLFHNPKSFDRLSDIYQEPSLRSSVETIVYCPSRFVDMVEHRWWLGDQQIHEHTTAPNTRRPSEALRDYDSLLRLDSTGALAQQAEPLLSQARSDCQRLKHVVLDCAVYTRDSVSNRQAAFRDVLVTSESSQHWKPLSDNDDTLNKVIKALEKDIGRSLDSLTMVNVSVPAGLDLTVFKHLKHVRIIDSTNTPLAMQNFPVVKISGLRLIYQAQLVESLQFRSRMLVKDGAAFLLTQRFAKLRYCRISGVEVHSAALAAFLKRHAETLEHLALGVIRLTAGNWTTFASDVSGHMKRLATMKIRSLYPADSHIPLRGSALSNMIEKIVLFDSMDRSRYPFPEQDTPHMDTYPEIGPQDEYNDVRYDARGNVEVW